MCQELTNPMFMVGAALLGVSMVAVFCYTAYVFVGWGISDIRNGEVTDGLVKIMMFIAFLGFSLCMTALAWQGDSCFRLILQW